MLRDHLTELLEPVINDLGYELLLLEYSPRDRSALLRLFIDAPNGIGLEDCERVSREVAGVLDVEDPIRSAYQLEVSSPGFDRPLVKPAHFERFRGEVAKVQMIAPVAGRKRFQGVITGFEDGAVLLDTENGPVSLPLADIEKARLVPNFDKEKSAS